MGDPSVPQAGRFRINETPVTKKTILIVDDSLFILERLMKMLQKLGTANLILTASNYGDAQQILQQTKIDITILDIHLQARSGIDLLRMARELYPDTLVIMLTNQVSEQVAIECKKLGADYFLDKSKDFAKIPVIFGSLD